GVGHRPALALALVLALAAVASAAASTGALTGVDTLALDARRLRLRRGLLLVARERRVRHEHAGRRHRHYRSDLLNPVHPSYLHFIFGPVCAGPDYRLDRRFKF